LSTLKRQLASFFIWAGRFDYFVIKLSVTVEWSVDLWFTAADKCIGMEGRVETTCLAAAGICILQYNMTSHLCCGPDVNDPDAQLVDATFGEHSFCCRLGV